ncbi:small GTP-binding protein, putative [Trichomonas vaginalis G3]|uniref:Small GTP-binding protein, putative n=1 Tax=Trichomonas vaginalis (strain ATCC PRA-98 / G3) TaxID=412133 RepID=A2DCC5_TRIV3|nr:GTPase protein [Trichomonas vaginalis G3]EAY21862.1 small GTP-binding protein, putative [Trichomonas vaginalis G3]KAI5487664.1 GTPase protein [Trichomonas vaginalis G3]|eukprot:XP_001582848.1 small GTP-binding protein [Trichomonas vaginalis G3]
MNNAELKVVLIGDSAVGKTSLFLRMKGDDFLDEQSPTIGVSCSIFPVSTEKGVVEFNMWDTAGQERFRIIVPMYFRKAAVILIVCDISLRSSFESIPEWVNLIRDKAPDDAKLIIVGNKCDLRNESSVSLEELCNMGEEYNAILTLETSAMNGIGIDLLKETIADQAFVVQSATEPSNKVDITTTETPKDKNKSCC